MPKNEKYLRLAKSRKNKPLDIDLQKIAKEYEKLLHKKFSYLFQGNLKVDFQFKKENFYHLLGFHKLTDVTVVRMVETHQMKRETFFEYVLSGRIGLDKTDKNIVDSDIIVNICDTKKKSDLGEIKANRFAVFSEKNILELLLSDPVIDFEDSDCDTLIDADKIFFKLHKEKMRNLNLFVGFDAQKNQHFISTFFLEMIADKFKIKKDGTPQSVIYILSRRIINTTNNETEDFMIKWENVRKELLELPCYRAQRRLKTWINSPHIQTIDVEYNIDEQQKMLKKYDKEKKKLQHLYHILELIKDLNGKDTKEHAILELMEYDIDAEVEEEIVEYIEKDAGKVKEQLDRIEHKASSLENKMSKFKQFLPELRLLEFEEVKYIYQQYLPEFKIEYEIVSQMIRDEKIYQKTLNPEKFKEYYNNYKDGMEIVYEEIAASVNPEESF